MNTVITKWIAFITSKDDNVLLPFNQKPFSFLSMSLPHHPHPWILADLIVCWLILDHAHVTSFGDVSSAEVNNTEQNNTWKHIHIPFIQRISIGKSM